MRGRRLKGSERVLEVDIKRVGVIGGERGDMEKVEIWRKRERGERERERERERGERERKREGRARERDRDREREREKF